MNKPGENRCQYLYRKGKKKGKSCGALIRGENQIYCKKHLKVISASYNSPSSLGSNTKPPRRCVTKSLLQKSRTVSQDILDMIPFFTINMMSVNIPL